MESGRNKKMVLASALLLALLLAGCTQQGNQFLKKDNPICKEDGKPVIRLYSTTWCPHCVWIKDAFDSVAKEYAEQGKIVAYHWELDTGDNTLTPDLEMAVPESEKKVFEEFSPEETIPAFVFGCKYYRIGNAYEAQDDLNAEAREFRTIIDKLVSQN